MTLTVSERRAHTPTPVVVDFKDANHGYRKSEADGTVWELISDEKKAVSDDLWHRRHHPHLYPTTTEG